MESGFFVQGFSGFSKLNLFHNLYLPTTRSIFSFVKKTCDILNKILVVSFIVIIRTTRTIKCNEDWENKFNQAIKFWSLQTTGRCEVMGRIRLVTIVKAVWGQVWVKVDFLEKFNNSIGYIIITVNHLIQLSLDYNLSLCRYLPVVAGLYVNHFIDILIKGIWI